MPRRAPDTKAELAKFSLRLPPVFREYFDGIDAKSQSVAARKLLAFAVANGGLAACGYTPTKYGSAYLAPAPTPSEPTDAELLALPLHMLTDEQAARLYGE